MVLVRRKRVSGSNDWHWKGRNVADNLSHDRDKLSGHRKAVREHVQKWHKYSEHYEKEGALKTIRNAQSHIARIKSKHPTLRQDQDRADTWSPGESL